MNLAELKKTLANGKVSPLYIFTGEELAIMDIYIDKICEVSNKKKMRLDNGISTIYSKMTNNSILDMSFVYIVRDDMDYMKAEDAWNKMLLGEAQGDNVVILIYSDVDKRSKFFNAHTDAITYFDKLPDEVLKKLVQKEFDLNDNNVQTLCILCESNYGRIMLEMDKLLTLSSALGEMWNHSLDDAFGYATKEGVIYVPSQTQVLDLVETICRHDIINACQGAQEFQEAGGNVLGLLTLLYSNFRQVLLVQSAGDNADIASRTGLSAWQIRMAKAKVNCFTIGELVRALRVIRETEYGIKTGTIDTSWSLNYLLTKIM